MGMNAVALSSAVASDHLSRKALSDVLRDGISQCNDASTNKVFHQVLASCLQQAERSLCSEYSKDAVLEIISQLNALYYLSTWFLDAGADRSLLQKNIKQLAGKIGAKTLSPSSELASHLLDVDFSDTLDFFDEDTKRLQHYNRVMQLACDFAMRMTRDRQVIESIQGIKQEIANSESKKPEAFMVVVLQKITETVAEVEKVEKKEISKTSVQQVADTVSSLVVLGNVMNAAHKIYTPAMTEDNLEKAIKEQNTQSITTLNKKLDNLCIRRLQVAIKKQLNLSFWIFWSNNKHVGYFQGECDQAFNEGWHVFVAKIKTLESQASYLNWRLKKYCQGSIRQFISTALRRSQYDLKSLAQLADMLCEVGAYLQLYNIKRIIVLVQMHLAIIDDATKIKFMYVLRCYEVENNQLLAEFKTLYRLIIERRGGYRGMAKTESAEIAGGSLTLKAIVVRRDEALKKQQRSFGNFFAGCDYTGYQIGLQGLQDDIENNEDLKPLLIVPVPGVMEKEIEQKNAQEEQTLEEKLKELAQNARCKLESKDNSWDSIYQRIHELTELTQVHQRQLEVLWAAKQKKNELEAKRKLLKANEVSKQCLYEVTYRLDAILTVAAQALNSGQLQAYNNGTSMASSALEVGGKLIPIPILSGIVSGLGSAVKIAGEEYRLYQASCIGTAMLTTSEMGQFLKKLIIELLFGLLADLKKIDVSSTQALIEALIERILTVLYAKFSTQDRTLSMDDLVTKYVTAVRESQNEKGWAESIVPTKLKLRDRTLLKQEVTFDEFLSGKLTQDEQQQRRSSDPMELTHFQQALLLIEHEQRATAKDVLKRQPVIQRKTTAKEPPPALITTKPLKLEQLSQFDQAATGNHKRLSQAVSTSSAVQKNSAPVRAKTTSMLFPHTKVENYNVGAMQQLLRVHDEMKCLIMALNIKLKNKKTLLKDALSKQESNTTLEFMRKCDVTLPSSNANAVLAKDFLQKIYEFSLIFSQNALEPLGSAQQVNEKAFGIQLIKLVCLLRGYNLENETDTPLFVQQCQQIALLENQLGYLLLYLEEHKVLFQQFELYEDLTTLLVTVIKHIKTLPQQLEQLIPQEEQYQKLQAHDTYQPEIHGAQELVSHTQTFLQELMKLCDPVEQDRFVREKKRTPETPVGKGLQQQSLSVGGLGPMKLF